MDTTTTYDSGKTKSTHNRWEDVDWSKRDVDIARELKVTRQRVSQKRFAAGEGGERPTLMAEVSRAFEGVDTNLMTPEDICNALGRPTGAWKSIREVMERLGMEHTRAIDQRPLNLWLEENNPEDFTIREVAEELGMTEESVRSRYHYKGITNYKPMERPTTRASYDWDVVPDWNAPAAEIAELVGAPIRTVYNKRTRMRKEGKA